MEGVFLSVNLHAEFDTGLFLWSLSWLAQLHGHLLLGTVRRLLPSVCLAPLLGLLVHHILTNQQQSVRILDIAFQGWIDLGES